MFFPHTHTHTHTHTHKHTHTHTHINHPVQVAAVREMIRNTQSTLLVLDSEGKALKRSVLSSFACCCKSPSLSSAPAFCYQSLFNAAHSPPPPPVRVQTHTHTHTHTKTHTHIHTHTNTHTHTRTHTRTHTHTHTHTQAQTHTHTHTQRDAHTPHTHTRRTWVLFEAWCSNLPSIPGVTENSQQVFVGLGSTLHLYVYLTV